MILWQHSLPVRRLTMSILLTGGAGFIGSHIAAALIRENDNVIIADNLSNSKASVIDRIAEITGRRPVFYRCDVSDAEAMESIFSAHSVEAVIHLAGFKAVGESVQIPVGYYRNNIDTTLTLLEVMRKHGCRRFVFSSSATVYGEQNPPPFTEDMPVGQCTNPYGRTKYFIEEILRDAAHADPQLSVMLLRYFNPIGAHESGLIGENPNNKPNNLMPFLTRTAAGKLPYLRIFGSDYPTPDGTCLRDYIHVMDLAEGHLAALRYTALHCGVEAVNLGTGRGYSVLEVVHAFERATGQHIPYEIAPRRRGDIAACYANPAKAEHLLGWKAEKTLEDMCRDAWRFQTKQNAISE